MWRVVVGLVVIGGLLAFVAGRLLCGKPMPTTPATTTDGEGLVTTNDGSLYFVRHPEGSFAVYLPGEWRASSRSSSNSASSTWTTDVTLRAKGGPDVTLQGNSTTPTKITVEGVAFDLAAGSFLRIAVDGTVEQLPFASLPSGDDEYLKRLNKYFVR